MKKNHVILTSIGLAIVIAGALLFTKFSNTSLSDEQERTEQVDNSSVEGDVRTIDESQVDRSAMEATSSAKPSHHSEVKNLNASEQQEYEQKIKLIDKVVSISRISDEFKAMDELMDMQFEQILSSPEITEEQQSDIEKIRQAVNGEKLLAEYKTILSKQMSAQQLETLSDIYEHPGVQELSEMKLQMQTPEGSKEFMEQMRTFDPSKISPEQLAAYKNFDKQSGETEYAMKMFEEMSNMFTPEGVQEQSSEEKDKLAQMMRETIEKTNLAKSHHMFSSNGSTPDDIRQISEQIGNPVYKTARDAQTQVLTNTMKPILSKFVEASKPNKKP